MTTLLATLAFYASNPDWHSWMKIDKQTAKAIKKLTTLGYLKTNEFSQAKFTGKVFE